MEVVREGGCLCGEARYLVSGYPSHVVSVIAVTANFVPEAHLQFWLTSSPKTLA